MEQCKTLYRDWFVSYNEFFSKAKLEFSRSEKHGIYLIYHSHQSLSERYAYNAIRFKQPLCSRRLFFFRCVKPLLVQYTPKVFFLSIEPIWTSQNLIIHGIFVCRFFFFFQNYAIMRSQNFGTFFLILFRRILAFQLLKSPKRMKALVNFVRA